MLEVVDGNAIAEYVLWPFLAGDEWRAGEGEEQRFWQRCAHVQRQRVVLAAVRFVGEHVTGSVRVSPEYLHSDNFSPRPNS